MNYINGAKILITGGTGSLGTALTKRLLSGQNGHPEKIVIFSRGEYEQATLHAENPDSRLEFIIGDIRDKERVELALQDIDIVIHTAAMKRIEKCEENPVEAYETNVMGTANLIQAIQRFRLPIHTFIYISSDKGCNPVNIYGSTKLGGEQVTLAANHRYSPTRFIAVCYGNVLSSRGSVIPIFRAQADAGMPLTVRDPDMTRFLITLDRAVDTIISALTTAIAGEVYIPIIPAATVGDIAKVIIGKRPISITIVGKGDNEKQHEILISDSTLPRVIQRDDYYVVTTKNQVHPILQKEYSSADYLISQDELRQLFIKYGFVKENE